LAGAEVRLPPMIATHYWRVRRRLPERFGQPCRVLARGRMNTILVEFEDGLRVTTSRWNVRRLPPPACQDGPTPPPPFKITVQPTPLTIEEVVKLYHVSPETVEWVTALVEKSLKKQATRKRVATLKTVAAPAKRSTSATRRTSASRKK
jgi:hypothetical protein